MEKTNCNIEGKRRIYCLTGLPPEVVAVAFAKCSRSPEAFDVIAAELNEDKTRKFHEKWIVGYGHSSVAEHAVLSIAVENISILATKALEDNRLASYTEKSTRYQVFDKTRYYKPLKLMQSKHGKLYEKTADFILDKYERLFPRMMEHVRKRMLREDCVSEQLHEARVRNQALDSLRYLLPVSVLTNLGMTVNARELENAVMKLLTHPLDEMKEIGEEIKCTALKVTPTLLKYTDASEYLAQTNLAMESLADEMLLSKTQPQAKVELVQWDTDAVDRIAACLLYRYSQKPYKQVVAAVRDMRDADKEKIIDEALSRMGKHDRPLRELEHASYTFDILIDYGAFRDIQRHRMATQSNQDFTVENGYSVPPLIIEAGMEKEYRECMLLAECAYREISRDFPKEAQYIIPLAYRRRVLFTMNLREIYHFVKLRSGRTSHYSYKKVAQEMYRLVKEKHPMLAKWMVVDLS